MENYKKNKLTEIFQKAKYEPGSDVAFSIWQTIVTRDRRINKFKLWIFTLSGLVSLTGLIPAIKMLSDNLSKSGIYEYFSLIFVNGGSIVSYWKELVFSLAESLPTMSIVLTLSLVFIFFLSLRYLMKQVGKNQFVNLTTLSI